jgi:hypothetical protein
MRRRQGKFRYPVVFLPEDRMTDHTDDSGTSSAAPYEEQRQFLGNVLGIAP